MTTTLFRKVGQIAKMASDSRVSYVNEHGILVRVFDSQDYFKVVNIGNVLYGFAGTNVIYKTFLAQYANVVANSDLILDYLVKIGQSRRVQFSFLRYDGQLKMFSYSPPMPDGSNEILLTSQSKPLPANSFAIGSGKNSKMYKVNKRSDQVQLPIYRIKSANDKACAKLHIKKIAAKLANGTADFAESKLIADACSIEGGDVFTGGEVRVMEMNTGQLTAHDAANQVQILDLLDQEAKSNGLVCASPINAASEIAELQKVGISPISQHFIKVDEATRDLYLEMSAMVDEAI